MSLHIPSSYSMYASSKATAKDVERAVKQDLDGSVVLTSHGFFLQNLLEINNNERLPVQLQNVINDNYSQTEKRWHGFPEKGQRESDFYGPFVDLANKITRETMEAFPAENHAVKRAWIDCHSISPAKTAKSVAEIRPDCAFVLNPDAAKDFGRKYYDLNSALGQKKTAAKSAQDRMKGEAGSKSESDKREAAKEQAEKLWWGQIIVAAEMKRAKKNQSDQSDQSAQYLGALPQLSGYIRQVLRQQLDRRFALGITISFNNIAIWLYDRSGALGMTQVYHIHENPEAFVRIISAISRLPSYRLGYDPTMKLYNPSLDQYQFSHQIASPPPQLDKSKWAVTVTDNRNLHEPVTHEIIFDGRPLLVRPAEVMNGRAVQVHQGYLRQESDKSPRTPLVIKTSWQPEKKIKVDEGSPLSFEAHFYRLIPSFKDRVLAASIVMSNHGWDNTHDPNEIAVSTMKYVRKHAQPDITAAKRENRSIAAAIGRKEDLDERDEPLAYMVYGDAMNTSSNHLRFAERVSDLTDRLQTRIVLKVWGWALQFFTCKDQFLANLENIVQDHLAMFEAGVLHRDVSNGNIIMQPPSPTLESNIWDLVSLTTGKLIDLDHAKAAKNWKTVGTTPSSSTVEAWTHVLHLSNIRVTGRAVAQAMKFVEVDDLTKYCRRAIEFDVLKSGRKGDWAPEDLGWHDVGEQPDFDSHTPDVVKRTGTIPFISHRLMNMAEPEVHNAIHDMESLFWVVAQTCLIRESGGGCRRADLREEFGDIEEPEDSNTTENPEDRERRERKKRIEQCKSLTQRIFDSTLEIMRVTKAACFKMNSSDNLERMLSHIHEYFDAFKDMLRRWRNVLVLGYNFQAYEFYRVHHYILKIIRDTREDPRIRNENRDTPVIQQELARRVKEYSFICNLPATQGGTISSSRDVPHSTPSPVPPSPANRVQPQLASRPQVAASRGAPSSTAMATTPPANRPQPHVSTPAPGTQSRHLTSFPTSVLTATRPQNVMPASVPTTPGPSRASSSNPTPTVPRQTPTSPKMPIPKKARKE